MGLEAKHRKAIDLLTRIVADAAGMVEAEDAAQVYVNRKLIDEAHDFLTTRSAR
jgi:hypothetical protein